MKKPVKAALFSALIFPGAGQLLLKKYLSAAYYAVFAGVGLFLLFSNLKASAEVLIDKAQLGEIAVELTAVTDLLNHQSALSSESLTPALMIWFVAWLVSVLEAYRAAKKEVNTHSS